MTSSFPTRLTSELPFFGERHRAAGALGDVLARHLGMNTAAVRAFRPVDGEEAAHFGKDPLERAGLVAACRFDDVAVHRIARPRSEEHTSELQSLMRISYAVFCLKKKTSRITLQI